MKKPEHALKAFIRFALAQGAIMYGMELMTALFSIVQGIVSTIMAQSGMTNGGVTELPAEIVEKIEAVGMLESIPLWIVTLLGSLLITVLSFIMILTVYGRMFKLYMYTAIAPIPISTFAGEPSQSVGKNFIKSYAGVCLEGAIIALACIRLFCQSTGHWGYVLKCSDHCVELCRGIGVQSAGAGGCGESI